MHFMGRLYMKTRVILSILLFSLNIGCSPTADKGLDQVNTLMSAGKISDAIPAATKLIERYPADPRFYYLRGFCYLSLRSLSSAEADFEHCIKLDPKYYGGYKGMASLSAIQGRYDLAEKNFKTAYDLSTTNEQKSAILQNIAAMYSGEIKDQKKAIEFFNKSIKLNDLGDWHFGLALAYHRAGKKEKAMHIWTTAVNEKIFKNVYYKHAAYHQIASYYLEMKNYALAKDYIQKALMLDPNNKGYLKTHHEIHAHLESNK